MSNSTIRTIVAASMLFVLFATGLALLVLARNKPTVSEDSILTPTPSQIQQEDLVPQELAQTLTALVTADKDKKIKGDLQPTDITPGFTLIAATVKSEKILITDKNNFEIRHTFSSRDSAADVIYASYSKIFTDAGFEIIKSELTGNIGLLVAKKGTTEVTILIYLNRANLIVSITQKQDG